MRDEQLSNARQLHEGLLRAPVADQASGGVEDLRSAPKGGKSQQKLVLRGTKRCAGQQLLERNEVAGGKRAAHARFHSGGKPEPAPDAPGEHGVADVGPGVTQNSPLWAARGARGD